MASGSDSASLGGWMDAWQDELRSYGVSFDEAVDAAADVMVGIGYRSRHSSILDNSIRVNITMAQGALSQLGMLCLRMDAILREGCDPLRLVPAHRVADAVAAITSARRLVAVVRAAQRTGDITGRLEAEIDGDVDELEDALTRFQSLDDILEKTDSLLATASHFDRILPPFIKNEMATLKDFREGGF